jgi:hypothetical protein
LILDAVSWDSAGMKFFELAAALIFATLWPAMAFIWLFASREE